MKDQQSIVQLYVHSDGYPSSIVRDLKQLKDLNKKMQTQRGASYTLAQFILLQKLRMMRLNIENTEEDVAEYKEKNTFVPDEPTDLLDLENFKELGQPMFMFGHGVENPEDGLHGDEEYVYLVDITPQHKKYEKDEWKIKVSEHGGNPSWDELDELVGDPFHHTDWEFEGKLDNAFDKYVED